MTSPRIRVDGKQLAIGDQRFGFHGVSYGTFRTRSDGARYPDRATVRRDFESMRAAGLTVVRTYTVPPADVLEEASAHGLRLLAGVFFPDWRYLVGASRHEQREVARAAHRAVAQAAGALAGRDEIVALVLANEVPADVVRWVGTRTVERLLTELVDVVKTIDDELLVTYGNYPTTEYLHVPTLDFLMHNVFLERQGDLRRYLTRLHQLAPDRPVVLGEIGYDAGTTLRGERRQAETLDWMLETALERGMAGTCVFSWTDEWWVGDTPVEDWHFGVTRSDRSPRPALDVVTTWSARNVADLEVEWPPMSVVVCAHNETATIADSVGALRELDYPNLEIVVVDDGSTDDTAAIVRKTGGASVRLVRLPHGGLSVARNEGARAATHDLIAYLDADAYPPREWPYYLALGFEGPDVGGAGGPNLAPPEPAWVAATVAHAPGSPVAVLLTDDRAEHLPGCNMAFRRSVLDDVGGFDALYTAAGDDIDLCWRVADRGAELAYHPAAFVWHHRRATVASYLRQQRGYGVAEALVEVRHPERFTATGAARWRGRMYAPGAAEHGRRSIHRGVFASGEFQSAQVGNGNLSELVRQVGVPIALGFVPSALLGIADVRLAIPGLLAALLLLVWTLTHLRRAPRGVSRWLFASLNVLQPTARAWGRVLGARCARITSLDTTTIPNVSRASDGSLVARHDRPRAQLVCGFLAVLRHAGLRLRPASAWAEHDARGHASLLIRVELVTSAHPPGWVQIALRRRICAPVGLLVAAALAGAILTAHGVELAIVGTAAMLDSAVGFVRSGPFAARALTRAPRERETPAPVEQPDANAPVMEVVA